jgi:hypothetical protein
MIDKLDLREILLKHETDIDFTKVDGSERTMKCSLRGDLLPLTAESVVKSKSKKDNPNVIAVFDLEKQEWRSIRLDSIKKICYTVTSI